MGTIWVKEFTGGLDTRRLPETSAGGTLMRARNGHITRGGEFEQRAAFVPTYDLPAGTVGMVATSKGLTVFGSAAAPAMPDGVSYQRLQHPDAVPALVRVLSADVFAGKIYAAAEFTDGSVHHFYDGTIISDWFDGRARASFTITAGTTPATDDVTNITVNGVSVIAAPVAWTSTKEATAAAVAAAINAHTSTPDYDAVANGATFTIIAKTPGTAPNGLVVAFVLDGITVSPVSAVLAGGAEDENTPGTFTITAGKADAGKKAVGSFRIKSASAGSTVASVTVNGVDIMSGAVAYTTSAAATAAAVAAAINAHASTPDFTASAADGVVTITAAVVGTASNNKAVAATKTGTMVLDSFVAMSGGTDPAPSKIESVKVDGIDITTAAITWTTSHQATAAALAANINANTGVSGYSATVSGATISLSYSGVVAPNTDVTFQLLNGLVITPSTLLLPETPITYQPGDFVKTIGQKMYAAAGPNMHFSGIKAPTKWTTNTVGAGFIDLSSEHSGAERLTALTRYQNMVAAFADRVIQTWYVDPDPALNRHVQTLENTGTSAPRSVTSFGDADIFYLDESGLRSLRARDSSNAAATNDIGIPVDSLITAKLATLSADEKRQIAGLIEPAGGRFWLVMRDEIFVFTFFGGSEISAWSTYDTTYRSGGSDVQFTVSDALVFDRHVYLRSGDTILTYGGLGAAATHDDTEAEAWLPYLDANDPTRKKHFFAVDAAVRGVWRIAGALDPSDEGVEDEVATITRTTYDIDGSIPFEHDATHVSLRFRSKGTGPHKLSACVVHYDGSDDDD